MEFKLDPPSGFSDSYFDIEFAVTIKTFPKAVITFYNETSAEFLNIMGVTSGYISNEKEIIIKNASLVQGHINLFSDDKMNKKFATHGSVNIKCKVDYFNTNEELQESEESIVSFYNESHSLDGDIIPFDIKIHNLVCNLQELEPVKIDLISGIETKYELCVRSTDGSTICPFEIVVQKGVNYIEIPAPMLYYDLDLNKNRRKVFQLYYIKFQGTNFSKLANRKYMPIPHSTFSFQIPNGLSPKPQSRKDPVGRQLNSEFVISDRYLVFVAKEHSGFTAKNNFGKEKLMDLTMLVNEGQDMENLSKEIHQFSDKNDSSKIEETHKIIHQHKVSKEKAIGISSNQFHLLKSVSGAYESIATKSKPQVNTNKKVSTFGINPAKKTECLPCSRKRQQHA